MAMSLESIANAIKMPILIAGASAYMILNLLGCNGNVISTPANTPTQPTRPAPTATFTPQPTQEPYNKPTPEATKVPVIPTAEPTKTATAVPATATPKPKSTYELALEKLNPKISQISRDFVKNLVEYNSSIGNTQELHKTYSDLEKIVDVVEKHPEIVNGVNQFGTDALALLITDNLGIVDMDKYWFLTNATALQAQDFFYAGNEIMWDGRFKEQIKGPAINKRFDEKEREITNFRLRKQIEWQGKWSTPLEYQKAVEDYGSEQRANNALRWRVLPQRLFVEDIKGQVSNAHPLYSTFDSSSWLVVASYNNENSEAVRGNILARLNDPQRYAKDVERITNYWKGGLQKNPHFGDIAKKALEYQQVILSEGTPYEKAALVITNHAEELVDHDNATSLFALWSTLVGASGGVGSARIIHPEGHETGDSQFMFTLSKATEQKLNGVFVYGINDLAHLLPLSEEDKKNPKYLSLDGLFGIYSNIDALRANGAKYLKVPTPSHRIVEIPIPK